MQDSPLKLRKIIERELSARAVPGCSIALVDPGGPVWASGFGFADVANRRPATPETVYHLFSGTKLFTAAAILQLVERGRLTLSDPVGRFIPDIGAASGITIEQLLSHRSGLRDTLRGFLAVSPEGDVPPDALGALTRYRIKQARAPGTRVEYRNVNYALLGAVITRVAGVDYAEFVTHELIEPLGMRAAYTWTAELRERRATGYMHRSDPMRFVLKWLLPQQTRRILGARSNGLIALREFTLDTAAIGGLIGSVPEFAKFLQEQLAEQPTVLSHALMRLMQTKVADGVAGIESRAGVALGWKLGVARGRPFLNHEGGGAGFTSELRLYPGERLGIALAMNAMRMPATMRVAHRICEAVLDVQSGARSGLQPVADSH